VDLAPLYTGVIYSNYSILSEDVHDKVDVDVDFRLAERIPGYDLIVEYSALPDGIWQRVIPEVIDELVYRAVLRLDPTKNHSYRIIQTYEDIVVRASYTRTINLVNALGSSEVDIYININTREGTVSIGCAQRAPSQVKAWQVEQVTMRLDNVESEFILEQRYGTYTSEKIDDKTYEAAEEVQVTVYYKDGETRALSFDPASPRFPLTIRR